MIDLHTHILPGMDDGSPDVDTSLEMLRRQREQGVTIVCATSHYYAQEESIDTFCKRRQRAFEKLEGATDAPKLLLGAEVAFYSGISRAEGLDRLCIGGTRTLMLEMPFCEWNDFQMEEVSVLALDRGYQVVLVHPERFCFSSGNRRRLEQMEALPISLQVNAGALLQWRTRAAALELLRRADRPLLASDCHNLGKRPPNLKEGRSVLQKKLGEEFLARIDKNGAALTQLRLSESI